MNVVFAGQDLPACEIGKMVPNSIFLAGPTPRSDEVTSWRPEALDLLRKQGFDGYVFVPETDKWGWLGDYEGQVRWEWEALSRAACTLFWVPRDLETMPGFTTNVEFGFMLALVPERVILGAPQDAPKLRYLRTLVTKAQNFLRLFDPDRLILQQPVCSSNLGVALRVAAIVAGS